MRKQSHAEAQKCTGYRTTLSRHGSHPDSSHQQQQRCSGKRNIATPRNIKDASRHASQGTNCTCQSSKPITPLSLTTA
eukprot:2187747-Rhodomonas_salina.1